MINDKRDIMLRFRTRKDMNRTQGSESECIRFDAMTYTVSSHFSSPHVRTNVRTYTTLLQSSSLFFCY